MTNEDRIRELEEEAAQLWSEIEPLLRAHDAVMKKLTELYDRKDAA